jgi:putative chitinase|tara:strand:- start:23919 stop:24530 length:612 start_codon:yes stop_codon:yes gene_type:complete
MSLIKLQEKIGATPDGSFGPNTMKKAMAYFKMTPERAAHFFGQTAHETGGFNAFSENLNYGASGLLGTFKKYFTPTMAEKYARQPEKIASRVYANRMGNGNEASKDGWKFRGRGALQTTGKINYTEFSKYLGKPEILTTPDLIATQYSFESAIFFFEKNKLWAICDKGVTDATILSLSKKINGGTNGLEDRVSLTKRYYNWVK